MDFADKNINYNMKVFILSGTCDGKVSGFPTIDSIERTFKRGGNSFTYKGIEYSTLFQHSWKEEHTEFCNVIYVDKTQIDWVDNVFNKYIKGILITNPEMANFFNFGTEE